MTDRSSIVSADAHALFARRLSYPLALSSRVLPIFAMMFLAWGGGISAAYGVEIGETLPPVKLPSLVEGAKGQSVDLSTYRGRLVYLDVWASWCAPCRQSMPVMNELRNEFAERGFEVVAVNVDESLGDALRFLRKTPVDYPILLDPKGTLPRALALVGMPTAYLVGPDGTVLYKHTGFKKSDVSAIRATIETFLPE